MDDADEALAFIALALKDLTELGRRAASPVSRSESMFLKLGERLAELSGQSHALEEKALELTRQGSVEALSSFGAMIEGLSEVLQDLVKEASGEERLAVLGGIEEAVGRLIERLGEFRRIVKILQMLGVSTRIESARLAADGRGFTTLADDVEGLADLIQTRSERIYKEVESLGAMLREARSRAGQMERDLNVAYLDAKHTIDRSLGGLGDVAAGLEQAAAEAAGLGANMRQSVDEAVSALLFHDIVRQQVEHVGEAAADLAADLESVLAKGDAGPEHAAEACAYVKAVCDLQSAQLADAATRFHNAVETVKSLLSGLGEEAANLSQLVGAVGRSGAEDNLLAQVETGLDLVVKAVHEFAHKGAEVDNVMARAAESAAQMNGFLVDVEEVGDEIELIAVNASVKAAHTGDKGKALGVLAGSIKELSQNAQELTTAAGGVLSEVNRAAKELELGAGERFDPEEAQTAAKELRGLSKRIAALDAGFRQIAAETARQSGRLLTEARAAVEGAQFHEKVRDALSASAERFKGLAETAERFANGPLSPAHQSRLQSMLDRYTMQAERLIHLGGAQAQGDEPGGVELF